MVRKKYKVWEYWCKAIGAKAYGDDRKADYVAIIRTFWVLLHVLTCLFIILNAIASHGWKLLGFN
jgi:hypothetical protein